MAWEAALPAATGNRLNIAHVGHGGQGAHRGGDCAAEIRRVHGVGDVQRAEVAGDIFPDMRIAEVFIIGGRRTDLQDLEHRLLMVTRPATGLARFTVSSNMMYG